MVDSKNLYAYSSSLISRFFKVLDLTKEAETDTDYENVERFVGGLVTEIEGCIRYYSNAGFGEDMTKVLMKINGIRTVSDYNVRRKAVLDSIEIITKVKRNLPDEDEV